MSEAVLSVSGLSKRFSRKGKTFAALEDVSFDIASGETLALVGPSGSGKSTVARIVLRLIEPDSGAIRFRNEDFLALKGEKLRKIRSEIQMVFQDPLAAFNPRATVARVLDDPLRIHKTAERSDRPRIIRELLERVGLPSELSGRAIHEISGGQRQRIAIARAIATKPALIVLDEAVSALDVSVRAQIIDLLIALQKSDNIAYLFISHDLGLVRSIANRVAIMEQGRIVETGDARTVISNPQSPIGKALVAAAPRLRRTAE
jgi:peptide/nickel transport system ATP-binding protein